MNRDLGFYHSLVPVAVEHVSKGRIFNLCATWTFCIYADQINLISDQVFLSSDRSFVYGLAIGEGLVTSDKLWVRWRQVNQLYQVVTSGLTILFFKGEVQSSLEKPTCAKRKGEKLWLVRCSLIKSMLF